MVGNAENNVFYINIIEEENGNFFFISKFYDFGRKLLEKTVFTAKADTPIEIRASNEKYIFWGEFFAKRRLVITKSPS